MIFDCKYHGLVEGHSNGKNKPPRCALCNRERVREKQREHKIRAVNLLGGKCSSCGYDKYVGALDFHHKDPEGKDFSISHAKMSWRQIEEEIKKCVLLCANCHREEHRHEG